METEKLEDMWVGGVCISPALAEKIDKATYSVNLVELSNISMIDKIDKLTTPLLQTAFMLKHRHRFGEKQLEHHISSTKTDLVQIISNAIVLLRNLEKSDG